MCRTASEHPSRERTTNPTVQAVVNFIRQYAQCFPGGRIPIIALKSYGVFLTSGNGDASGDVRSVVDTVNAIVESCRAFDADLPVARDST